MDVKAIFSDIDGTIVHYHDPLVSQGYVLVKDAQPPSLGAIPGSPDFVPEKAIWKHQPSGTEIECYRVPSMTLGGGYISCRTLELVELLRQRYDIKFCIVTGARTGTLQARRGCGVLPRADFDVAEGGGRIWQQSYKAPAEPQFVECLWQAAEEQLVGDQDAVLGTNRVPSFIPSFETEVAAKLFPFGFTEKSQHDDAWLNRFIATIGPWEENDKEEDPLKRQGKLWDAYRQLAQDYPKCKLDAASYCSAFLLDHREALKEDPEIENKLRLRFETEFNDKYDVSFFTNLGKGHISASQLGKRSAVEHIAKEKLGIDPAKHAVALFDDENDLQFAKVCGAGFIPSVAHPKVLEDLRTLSEGQWKRTTVEGLLGTEEALVDIVRLKLKYL